MAPCKPHPLVRAQDCERAPEVRYEHPVNPRGVRHTRSLGDAAGLTGLGVHLVRLLPGDESTAFHRHHVEEEFVYILRGRARAEIGDDILEVGPGDFMGFGRLSLAHSMSNPYDEEVHYLVGGLRPDFDICDYPRSGRRLICWSDQEQWVDLPPGPDRDDP